MNSPTILTLPLDHALSNFNQYDFIIILGVTGSQKTTSFSKIRILYLIENLISGLQRIQKKRNFQHTKIKLKKKQTNKNKKHFS